MCFTKCEKPCNFISDIVADRKYSKMAIVLIFSLSLCSMAMCNGSLKPGTWNTGRSCIKNTFNYCVWDNSNRSIMKIGAFFTFGATGRQWMGASSLTRFLDHTQRCTTVGRTPLDEWSARRRDLYLTTHDPTGIEPTASASQRQQTYALDRDATGTGQDLRLWPISIPPKHQ